jgi:hypothetical protein
MIAFLTRNATPVISVPNSTWLMRGSSNTKKMTSDTTSVRTSRFLVTDTYVLRIQNSYGYFSGRRNKWSRFPFIPIRWILSSFKAVPLKISKSLHRPYKQLHASATSDTSCDVYEWLQIGFGLVVGFIAHFNTRLLTTLYSSLSHTHTHTHTLVFSVCYSLH